MKRGSNLWFSILPRDRSRARDRVVDPVRRGCPALLPELQAPTRNPSSTSNQLHFQQIHCIFEVVPNIFLIYVTGNEEVQEESFNFHMTPTGQKGESSKNERIRQKRDKDFN